MSSNKNINGNAEKEPCNDLSVAFEGLELGKVKEGFVDTSMFIKEFMEDNYMVTCILRPRSFGKSVKLAILKSFLSLGQPRSLFDGLLIAEHKEFVRNFCGVFPVVFLDFSGIQSESWAEMYQTIWIRVQEMINRHSSELTEALAELKHCGLDMAEEIAIEYFEDILQWLTESLQKKHNRPVFVLIDDFDAPLIIASENGYLREAEAFFCSFYVKAFTRNPKLAKACIMGSTSRISLLVPGMINTVPLSETDRKYSQFFSQWN